MEGQNIAVAQRNNVAIIGVITMLIISCLTAVQSTSSAIGNLLIFEASDEVNRRKRKFEDEQRPLMKNLFNFRHSPQAPLGPGRNRFGDLVADENRGYCQKLTHMYSWELEELLDRCEQYIIAPRVTKWRKKPNGSKKGIVCV